jgi:hypothetical protein
MSKTSKRFGMEINVETGEISKVELSDIIEETPINEEIICNDSETV